MSVPQKPNGNNSFLDQLNQKAKENSEKPIPQLQPLMPAVTSTMGKELCVPEVTGRFSDLNKEANKVAAVAFANKLTFDILENTGTYDPYKSTLGLKLRTKQGKDKFLRDMTLMNNFIKRKGDDGKLFIKNLTPEQMTELVGYENYSTDENVGLAKNPSAWEKWNDENIIQLIKQGAQVTWYGEHIDPQTEQKSYPVIELGGKLYENMSDEEKGVINAVEKDIKDNKFSFHQVYIPKNVPVLDRINSLVNELNKGKSEITEPEEEAEQINMDRIGEYGPEKRTGINEFYPVNPKGKYVVTKMLENPPEIGIWNLGTGLMSLRGKGAFESSYQGVLLINDVLEKVLGKENFTYITGTVNKIVISNEIEVDRPPIIVGGVEIKSAPRKYKPGKLFLVRGLYIDALGNFKVCQVSVKIDLGDNYGEAPATKNATAKQLMIRKMVTTVYPIFRTINEKDNETLSKAMTGLIDMIGFEGKQNLITTQIIREKGGEKIIGGGKRSMISGSEMKSIVMGEDNDEDRLRKIYSRELIEDMIYYLDQVRVGEERRAPERRTITEKKLTVPEEPMDVERPADVHYHDANGEYVGVNREEQREIEQQIHNGVVQMEQERREGEN